MIPLQAITKKYDLPPEEKGQKSDAPKAKKVGFIDMLKTMSGPMIPYFFSQSIAIARDGFFYALLTYFTTYVLNNPMVMGYANTLQSVGGLIGAMFITTVEKTFGRKWGYIYGLFAQAVLFVLIAYFGGTAAGFLIIRTVIAVVTGATGAFAAVQANDIADWQIMHGKADARAFIQSLSGTTVRVGGVLGSMISSFGLAALGYQTGTVPSETVLKGMINLLAWGPSAVCVIAAVIFMFYKIDDKALNEWRAERDAAKAAEE
jgi:Na+/melibiose symporter-like transporter